mmetsp:Transcript_687/g.2054  ORF Transcript_687/g.2054 Transcript_687/m.2054 type:complete len:155 (-) Transcript_687:225-689(-)
MTATQISSSPSCTDEQQQSLPCTNGGEFSLFSTHKPHRHRSSFASVGSAARGVRNGDDSASLLSLSGSMRNLFRRACSSRLSKGDCRQESSSSLLVFDDFGNAIPQRSQRSRRRSSIKRCDSIERMNQHFPEADFQFVPRVPHPLLIQDLDLDN